MAPLTPNRMQDILQGRAAPSAAEVIEMLVAHPTCVLPAALCLRRGAADATAEERRRLTHAAALGCADRVAMADLADIAGQDWASIYPPVDLAPQKSTQDAIDVFIETYGRVSPQEDALLEKLIFNPVAPDYFQGIDEPYDPSSPLALPPELQPAQERPQEAAPGPTAQKAPQPPEPQPAPTAQTASTHQEPAESHEEPSLMESLAKIYIKQRRYDRALEIISNLSLKYPEKSVYFADQIRFLRKLVSNQRRWDASART